MSSRTSLPLIVRNKWRRSDRGAEGLTLIMHATLRFLGLAIVAGAIALLPHTVSGDDRGRECERGQDCALGAFKDGEIQPLSAVLAVVREKMPGEVVKIELEREDGAWVYEIKILTSSGRRRKLEINARTLAIIKAD